MPEVKNPQNPTQSSQKTGSITRGQSASVSVRLSDGEIADPTVVTETKNLNAEKKKEKRRVRSWTKNTLKECAPKTTAAVLVANATKARSRASLNTSAASAALSHPKSRFEENKSKKDDMIRSDDDLDNIYDNIEGFQLGSEVLNASIPFHTAFRVRSKGEIHVVGHSTDNPANEHLKWGTSCKHLATHEHWGIKIGTSVEQLANATSMVKEKNPIIRVSRAGTRTQRGDSNRTTASLMPPKKVTASSSTRHRFISNGPNDTVLRPRDRTGDAVLSVAGTRIGTETGTTYADRPQRSKSRFQSHPEAPLPSTGMRDLRAVWKLHWEKAGKPCELDTFIRQRLYEVQCGKRSIKGTGLEFGKEESSSFRGAHSLSPTPL